jgi:hypothetical protein
VICKNQKPFTLEDVCEANHQLTQQLAYLGDMVYQIKAAGAADPKCIESLQYRIWDAQISQKLIFAPLQGDYSISEHWIDGAFNE